MGLGTGLSPDLVVGLLHVFKVADLAVSDERLEALLALLLAPTSELGGAELGLRDGLDHLDLSAATGAEEAREAGSAGQERVDGAGKVHNLRGRDASAVAEVIDEADDGPGFGKLATPRGVGGDFHQELSGVTGLLDKPISGDSKNSHGGFLGITDVSPHFGKGGLGSLSTVLVGLSLSEHLRSLLLSKPEFEMREDAFSSVPCTFCSMFGPSVGSAGSST